MSALGLNWLILPAAAIGVLLIGLIAEVLCDRSLGLSHRGPAIPDCAAARGQ